MKTMPPARSTLGASLPALALATLAPFASTVCAQQSAPAPEASTPAQPTVQDDKSATAIPVGLSEPMGPPTDPFNDTRTLGHVVGGLRIVPDVNVAYFYETNPLRVAANGPGDRATVLYTTVTVSDAKGGPRKLFAGAAQTRWQNVNEGSDPRRTLSYEDRFSLAGWRFPVRLGYHADVVSRSSFLSRRITAETRVEQRSLGIDAVRSFGDTRLALALRAGDVAIGVGMSADGQAVQSSNSNSNVLMRARVTHALTPATSVYALAQAQDYRYKGNDTAPINPTSEVTTTSVGAQWQPVPAWTLAADVGQSDKRSGRPDLVPAAQHPVGSLRASFDPSTRTSASVAYARSVEELNDSGVSNLALRTVSLGLAHRFTATLATTMSYDRTDIRTNELSGNVVDSKLFGTLLWKPHRQVLTAIAFSRTQRKVVDLSDFVRPFTNDRFLVNVTYYF